ncbi:hypothetical protein PoB_007243100 [Plakobranchus ocellatus]|uniref:Uncharacterized protein n=1 Tax=Plakobranchus ocellatus TaxID=259542 RepID=A0AAV4DPW7_9GAST|nr:hypothetical protein PoB_007243100 [Plakobranchus ocellatus]
MQAPFLLHHTRSALFLRKRVFLSLTSSRSPPTLSLYAKSLVYDVDLTIPQPEPSKGLQLDAIDLSPDSRCIKDVSSNEQPELNLANG